MFNPEKPIIESERKESEKDREAILETKDIQLRIYNLYEQKLLTENEAVTLLKEISSITDAKSFQVFREKISVHDAIIVENADKECEEFIRVKEIKQNIEQMIKILDINNWDENFSKIVNQIKDFEGEDYSENVIKALLAKYLEKTYNIYRANHKNADDFSNDIKELTKDNEFIIPNFLKVFKHTKSGERQPSFQESIKETLERLRKIESLEKYLKNDVEAIVIGGSMSYGLFYNIRGGDLDVNKGSDIDIITIIENDRFQKDYLNGLKDVDFFTDRQKEIFLERKMIFARLKESGKADILTQKFQVEDKNFDISIHFFPKEKFKDMIGEKLEKDLDGDKDIIRVIKEYRESNPNREYYTQRNFNGEDYRYHIPPSAEVEDGVITESPAYIIKDGN